MVLTRSSAQTQPRMSLRRSNRLNGTDDAVERTLSRSKRASSLKRKKDGKPTKRVLRVDVGSSKGCLASAVCARSSRRTLQQQESELSQRRKDIIEAEENISAQWEELEQREEELLHMQTKHDAQAALTQLEEQFQCPLCYEIMALPYTLTPAECGHTFCALCTLKWFFSRLHRSCGSWHESVDCPICRSLLILTPDTTPRTVITVPFTPNRLAGKVIENLVAKLEGGKGLVGSDGKRSTKGRACKQPNGCAGKRVKSESRTPGLFTSDAGGNTSLESWAVGGELWKDLRERERLGRTEMDDIIGRWCHLSANDFVAIKRRLGV